MSEVDELLRQLAPAALGALVRRHGDFDAAEDALQEAMVAAVDHWPTAGVPVNPTGWLIAVANRRLIDAWRSDRSRRQRELTVAAREPLAAELDEPHGDDSLALIFMCCHPALSESSQLALTLRAVGGLTTAQIARAFFVLETTMAQRISRAKATIKANAISFQLPGPDDWEARLQVVLHVLYLVFNEGYASTAGSDLLRTDLTGEAIRLARELHRLLPDDGEVTGLLALMLLTDARRPSRLDSNGELVPLAEQDRSRWNRAAIAEGIGLVSASLGASVLGPYQLQAAIAALHDEAATAAETDWPQILALYELLERMAPNPMVTLNRVVAQAMVHGPRAGLAQLDGLEHDPALAGHHRLAAVRAHLFEQAGDLDTAHAAYLHASRLTTSLPEQRYLISRANRLHETATP